MLYTALEILGWIIAAFVLGLLLMWLLMRGRTASGVSSREWEIAQAKLKQAEDDRRSFENQRVQLNADLDARTRQVTELESDVRSLEVKAQSLGLDVAETVKIDMPYVEAPHIDVPYVDAPRIDMPGVDAPDVDLGALPMPDLEIPSVEAPQIPDLNVPSVEAPQIADLDIPSVEAPQIADLDIPSVEAPIINTPDVAAPSVSVQALGAVSGNDDSSAAEIDDLVARLAATQQEAARVSDLEARIEELTQANADAAANSASTKRIAELESEVEQLRGRLDQASAVEGRLADLEVEAGRVAGLEAQLESLRAERNAAMEQAAGDASSGSLADLQRELDDARTGSANELAALQQQVAELQADAQRVHEIEAELESARRAATEHDQLLAAARRLADERQHDLDTSRGEIEGAREELDEAQARAAALEAELTGYRTEELSSTPCRKPPSSSTKRLPASRQATARLNSWLALASSKQNSPKPRPRTKACPPLSPRCCYCGLTPADLLISRPRPPSCE